MVLRSSPIFNIYGVAVWSIAEILQYVLYKPLSSDLSDFLSDTKIDILSYSAIVLHSLGLKQVVNTPYRVAVHFNLWSYATIWRFL